MKDRCKGYVPSMEYDIFQCDIAFACYCSCFYYFLSYYGRDSLTGCLKFLFNLGGCLFVFTNRNLHFLHIVPHLTFVLNCFSSVDFHFALWIPPHVFIDSHLGLFFRWPLSQNLCLDSNRTSGFDNSSCIFQYLFLNTTTQVDRCISFHNEYHLYSWLMNQPWTILSASVALLFHQAADCLWIPSLVKFIHEYHLCRWCINLTWTLCCRWLFPSTRIQTLSLKTIFG